MRVARNIWRKPEHRLGICGLPMSHAEFVGVEPPCEASPTDAVVQTHSRLLPMLHWGV
jgi:hypothetical protein